MKRKKKNIPTTKREKTMRFFCMNTNMASRVTSRAKGTGLAGAGMLNSVRQNGELISELKVSKVGFFQLLSHSLPTSTQLKIYTDARIEATQLSHF
uniref:Uncharacterized protein n=1 Tax=Anguilla anguilla TaxID=7936 RepID=A0A0E9WV53_ANGAN